MPKVSPIYNDFRGGEFSPLMYGRTDLEEYRNGLKECLNMIPIVQGGAISRPGTEYSSQTKYRDKDAVYIPFQYSTVQAYVLEFGDGYIRFHKDGGQILEASKTITDVTNADPCVLTIVGHGFTTGKEIYIANVIGTEELNLKNFKVTVLTADTISIANLDGTDVDSTGFGAYTSGGTASQVYEVASPYTEMDVPSIQYAQSIDVLYLVHHDYPIKTLSRYSHTNWVFADYEHTWGPFLAENLTKTSLLTVSAVTGSSITITASGTGNTPFSADMVGAYIGFRETIEAKNDKWETNVAVSAGARRWYDGKVYEAASSGTTGTNPPVHDFSTESDGAVNWTFLRGDRGYAVITGFTSQTVVTADVIERIPDTYLTPGWHQWSEGSWSEKNGYPSTIIFYDGRIWFGGSNSEPQTLWATASGSYNNFKAVNVTGDVSAEESLTFTIDSADVNVIEWLSDEERALMVGTTGGEWIVRPYKIGEVLSATNISVKRSTANGSANVMPVRVDRASLYIQKSGKKLRELAYVYEIDGFRSPDMTIVSEHITGKGLTKIVLMREPQPIIWAVREDGALLSFTYDRMQSVLSWAKHDLNGIVKSITVIPEPNGKYDQLWVMVQRDVAGVTINFNEIMTVFNGESAGKKYSHYVDCGLVYSGVPTRTITGLGHLEGETVSVFADGSGHPDVEVSNGSITLQEEKSYVVAGLGYTKRLQLLPIEAGAADGTSQGKTKRVHRMTFRFHNTMYARAGYSVDKLQLIIFRNVNDELGESYPLFSGDKALNWGGDYDTEGNIVIQSNRPMPMNILAVMPQLITQDRG